MTTPANNGVAMYQVLGTGVFQASPDALEQFARTLNDRSTRLKSLSGDAAQLRDQVTADAADFIGTHTPAPIYKETVDAVTETGDTFTRTINGIARQLEDDASGLAWIAQHLRVSQEHLAEEIRKAAPDSPVNPAGGPVGTGNGGTGSAGDTGNGGNGGTGNGGGGPDAEPPNPDNPLPPPA